VKPTIIDPAGQPKNRPAQLPFSRTAAPDTMGLVNPQAPGGNPGGAGPVGEINKFQNKPWATQGGSRR